MKHWSPNGALFVGATALILGGCDLQSATTPDDQDFQDTASVSSALTVFRTLECTFKPPLGAPRDAQYGCTVELLMPTHYRMLTSCRGTTRCAMTVAWEATQPIRIRSADSTTLLVTTVESAPAQISFPTFLRTAHVTKGPWMSDVTEHSAVVRWETNTDAQSWLLVVNTFNQVPHDARWIKGSSACPLGVRLPCLHTASINKLRAGNRYDYVIGDGLAPDDITGWSHSSGGIRTAPSPTTNFSFSVFADIQGGAAWADISRYTPMPAYAGPVLHTGDMVGSTTEWPSFFSSAEALLARRPFYPALGNNEPQASFLRYFAFPSNPSGRMYRSFNYGNTHFVLLDSTNSSFATDDTQVTWFKSDLTSSPATSAANIVLVVHHNAYGYGQYGDNTGLRNLLQALSADATYQQAFAKIRLVVGGHQHYYERIFQDYMVGTTRRRVRFLTMGTAGADSRCHDSGPHLEAASALACASAPDDTNHYQSANFEVRGTIIEGRIYDFRYDAAGSPMPVPTPSGSTSRHSLLDCFAFDEFGHSAPLASPCRL